MLTEQVRPLPVIGQFQVNGWLTLESGHSAVTINRYPCPC